jgi:ATP-binding cassette subfamily A (ABC1) protein 3
MKRRLSAAMAMIGDPPVVFLDEPTSGVDAVSRRQFWKIISSLRDAGQAIILTSHRYIRIPPLNNSTILKVSKFKCHFTENNILHFYILLISMEECEFLCSRLGIMVNGEMQCLGGVQHLKNKFAQGFTLSLRLKQEALQNVDGINALSNLILNRFHPCTIKDQHQVIKNSVFLLALQ